MRSRAQSAIDIVSHGGSVDAVCDRLPKFLSREPPRFNWVYKRLILSIAPFIQIETYKHAASIRAAVEDRIFTAFFLPLQQRKHFRLYIQSIQIARAKIQQLIVSIFDNLPNNLLDVRLRISLCIFAPKIRISFQNNALIRSITQHSVLTVADNFFRVSISGPSTQEFRLAVCICIFDSFL